MNLTATPWISKADFYRRVNLYIKENKEVVGYKFKHDDKLHLKFNYGNYPCFENASKVTKTVHFKVSSIEIFEVSKKEAVCNDCLNEMYRADIDKNGLDFYEDMKNEN